MNARWQVCFQPYYGDQGMGAPVEVISAHRWRFIARWRAGWTRVMRPDGDVWVESYGVHR